MDSVSRLLTNQHKTGQVIEEKKIENKFTNSFRENLYKKRIDLFLGKREKVEENHFQ